MTSQTVVRGMLLASLILNAFLGGILVGHVGHRRPFAPPPGGGPHDPMAMVDQMTRTMGADDAKILKDAFASRQVAAADAERTMRTFGDRLNALLSAPTLDGPALTDLLHQNQAAHAALDTAMSDSLVEAATKMSPEGRRKLSIDRPPPGGPAPGPAWTDPGPGKP